MSTNLQKKLDLDERETSITDIASTRSEGGFTLIEMLVSSFIMVIVLVLTLMVFVTYNQSFNATLSLTKAQLQAEAGMNSLASIVRSISDCPPATSTATMTPPYQYPASSPNPPNSLLIMTPFSNRTFKNSTTGTTTDVEQVVVSLNSSTHILTAIATPCPGFTATGSTPSTNEVISIDHVMNLTYTFYNATSSQPGEPEWTSAVTPSPSTKPAFTSSLITVGIGMSLVVGDAGHNIALQNTGYFINLYCSDVTQTQPPPGAGGCVI